MLSVILTHADIVNLAESLSKEINISKGILDCLLCRIIKEQKSIDFLKEEEKLTQREEMLRSDHGVII